MFDERFLLELLELLYPLPYEPVHIFHVHFSTCFKLSAYIVNFPHRVNKTRLAVLGRRLYPLAGRSLFGYSCCKDKIMGFTEHDKSVLISFAHRAVKDFVEKGLKDEPGLDSNNLPSVLTEKKGVFVAIYHGATLRGCIGNVLPVMPIWLACMENARNAAYKDPRFAPLHSNELGDISFEIAVMETPRLLSVISQLRTGIHGILLTKGFIKEVFLPETLKDLPSTLEELFANLRTKADMDEDHEASETWEFFEAEVVSDRNTGTGI
jgi:uncharacterized protein